MEAELARRYSWLGVIVAVITGSLVTITVRQMLSEARVKLSVAEALQESAGKRLTATAEESESLARKLAVEEQQHREANQRAIEQFDALSKQAASLSASLANTSTASLSVSTGLRAELDKLNAIVKELVEGQTAHPELLARIAGLETRLAKSQVLIDETSAKAERARYSVRIRSVPGSEHVAKELADYGFVVSALAPTSTDPDDYVTLLIDQALPPPVLRYVTQTALSKYPGIKYIIADGGSATHPVALGTTVLGFRTTAQERARLREVPKAVLATLGDPATSDARFRETLDTALSSLA